MDILNNIPALCQNVEYCVKVMLWQCCGIYVIIYMLVVRYSLSVLCIVFSCYGPKCYKVFSVVSVYKCGNYLWGSINIFPKFYP